MAIANAYTISLRRAYVSTDEELEICVSATFELEDPDSEIALLARQKTPELRDALDRATDLALDPDYATNPHDPQKDKKSASLFETDPGDHSPKVLAPEIPSAHLLEQGAEPVELPTELSSESNRDATAFSESHPAGSAQEDTRPVDVPVIEATVAAVTNVEPSVTPRADLPINRPKQLQLSNEAKRLGIDDERLVILVVDLYRKPSLARLTRPEADDLLRRLKDGSALRLAARPDLKGAAA